MIPFNKPYLTGQEINKITEAYELGQMAGDGHFSSLCSNWLEKNTGAQRALLTHSCTAALEMAAAKERGTSSGGGVDIKVATKPS